ncbi:MAG: hypothetical protein SXV54_10990 [Chloroflexota bacterium]|nr:hypothetical protein [Chloroflexota bacterium]
MVEYRFRAYSPPDDLEALLTNDCRVTYADAPVTGTNLADVRADLEERGFELHGAHPIKTHHPENRVRITASSARPIADIAADVQRRFVPRYLEAYSQVRKRLRLAEEAERHEAAILAELAAILDEWVSDDKVIRYSNDRTGHHVYGRVEVARNRVKIDLSGLPVATAREICRLLREIK